MRTLLQSLVTPVITTSLYFVVFGAAIGGRMAQIDGVPYGSFIVPGLVMLALFTESLNNASFGIYLPKFTGTIYELSRAVSYLEIVLAYVGAATTKSVVLGLVILITASIFVPVRVLHPVWMVAFLVLTATTFSLFGFILGVGSTGLRAVAVHPDAGDVTPFTFLGGAFYSIDMLPAAWRTVSLFNPVVYLINGFRWSFYGISDVSVGTSLAVTLGFFVACLLLVGWIFRTGYRLKN